MLTKIEWTDEVWNPLRGCTRVSEGCRNCYAERVAARFSGPGMPYDGLATMTKDGPRWTGAVKLVEDKLEDPLRWRRPRKIFVNSMSDLFHESVPDEWIDYVFSVMYLANHHTFQILTKRPKRMSDYLSNRHRKNLIAEAGRYRIGRFMGLKIDCGISWPISNIWLGVSVENQSSADERIPLLLQTPAAVRWISAEPLLGPIELFSETTGDILYTSGDDCNPGAINWVVAGGESGPYARPFRVEWARSLISQCHGAHDGVPIFIKQLGSYPILDPRYDRSLSGATRKLRDKKGGDMSEWPEDLRVREFPGEIK